MLVGQYSFSSLIEYVLCRALLSLVLPNTYIGLLSFIICLYWYILSYLCCQPFRQIVLAVGVRMQHMWGAEVLAATSSVLELGGRPRVRGKVQQRRGGDAMHQSNSVLSFVFIT